MAPNFRPNTQTRRGNRSGYVEHDDFEGLPVRQWRQEWVKIGPPPPTDTTQKNDIWAIELPHGMPKDSHLLPTHTQELLRAARSGRLYKRPAPAEEEEVDPDAALAEKPEKKEEDPSIKGYRVKVWKQVARNAEGTAVSHLAKRRKGVITLSSSLPAGPSSSPIIMKATVRRIDAAGNPYTQEITLNEGQPVDGEIISTTVVPAPNATANGETSVAATPVRRRPPPPKRKPKGPGRGRKKKLPLPTNTRPEATNTGVDTTTDGTKLNLPESDNTKQDDHSETKNQDSEMADDDDGDDGEDDGDDGEDGDDGDEEDSEMPDGENGAGFRAESETKPDSVAEVPPAITQAEPSIDTIPSEISPSVGPPLTKAPSPPSNSNLNPVQPLPQHVPSQFEGSPLKNVVAATSPADLSPKLPPIGEIASIVATTDTRPSETSLAPVPALTDPIETVPQGTESAAAKLEVDVEMTDGPRQEQTETLVPPVVEEEAQQPDVSAVNPLPTVNPVQGEDASTHRSPPPAAMLEITNIEQPIEEVVSETVVSVVTNQEPQGPEAAPAPAPAPALVLADDLPAPGPIDTKAEGATIEGGEENEPESPDLFSGLEAALNQQGGPKEATPPPETKAA
ncbi:uncharacterized protein F4817DRAFT_333283 [Daldinia loculata]|uniref:uncharacterized protein n=1 Tax=Daldinia loculata TaxID=103429 RepID=UPI0020C5AC37|nr:uncharacterized protein F4817DRAFT_333283 [Daldinia loculata]KAI1648877.1 hypothetical protein F4817DRAFT_333283 [Daldinia loculata]